MSVVVLRKKGSRGIYGTMSTNGIQTTNSTPTLFEFGTTVEDLIETYRESGNKEIARDLEQYDAVPAAWEVMA